MRHFLFFLIIFVTLAIPPVMGQDVPDRNSGNEDTPQGLPDLDADSGLWSDPLSEAADEAEFRKGRPPLIAPKGWLDDYDYESELDTYLNEKYQAAFNSGKNTYLYLFADWRETCKIFRKKAQHKDYTKLLSSNEIIMLDYNFFRKKFNTRARFLPMILKVNENGLLGPEYLYPVTGANEHPRKTYHTLRKFFESNKVPG